MKHVEQRAKEIAENDCHARRQPLNISGLSSSSPAHHNYAISDSCRDDIVLFCAVKFTQSAKQCVKLYRV